ncbi:MAG: M42 family metallopeptidase [Bdellovibrionota bacterium]|jgi:putative aminopeptidase FrvX
MEQTSKQFLYDLLTTPSPTGFEQKVQKVIKNRMEPYADIIETDLHGNLIVGINTKAERKVMLAGHCDQLGFLVKFISDDGYLYIEQLGGYDPVVLPGSQVTIYTEKKGEIAGVIGRKPIHLQKQEERGQGKITFEDLWVDIGAKNRKDAEKYVTLGDHGTVKLGVTELCNGLICSPGLDDKSGVFVVMEALRLCAKSKLNVALYAVSTVQEEVGLRGARTSAFGIDPEVGIAVDVTFATDNPGIGDKKMAECKLGAGPAFGCGPTSNPIVDKMLVQAAENAKCPYQLTPTGRIICNDSAALQISRSGVAAGSVQIPNRYMHTQVEVCSLKDMENAAKLVAAFVKSIKPSTSFKPV